MTLLLLLLVADANVMMACVQAAQLDDADLGPASSSYSSSTCTDPLAEVLTLERAAWSELDAIAALTQRVHGKVGALPYGLLQLRPPPPLTAPTAVAAGTNHPSAGVINHGADDDVETDGLGLNVAQPPAAEVACDHEDDFEGDNSQQEGCTTNTWLHDTSKTNDREQAVHSSSSSSNQVPAARSAGDTSNSSSTSPYACAASDGNQVYADPLYPPLRRASRFSYAVAAAVLDIHPGEGRQAFLECPTVVDRLRIVLSCLIKHRKVLAAWAAVKGMQEKGSH